MIARVRTHLQLKHSKSLLFETNIWLEKEVSIRTNELNTAKKELEELDLVKNEFLNLLNHEIRTPLHGILGSISVISEYETSDEMRQFLQMLDLSARRLEKFSNKALDISTLRTKGPEELTLTDENLTEILQEVVLEISETAKQEKITITVSEMQIPLHVIVDKPRIHKAMLYIIDNAIRFSEPGSCITINAKQEAGKLTIEIKDHGQGFSEYALQNLFKPFCNTRHHYDSSTGLSLYFAKLVMNAHKGDISILKNSPTGSIVKLVF